jgi:hypothetical protein
MGIAGILLVKTPESGLKFLVHTQIFSDAGKIASRLEIKTRREGFAARSDKTNFLMTAAAAAPATPAAAGEFIRRRDAAEFDGFGHGLFHRALQFVHFFLRVEEAGGDGIFEECVAFTFKRGDFRRFQRLTAVLFFL